MFFSGLFQRKSDAPVTTPAELADAIGLSYDTYTGKQISSQRAMRLTAVFSCVRVLAESVGMLPCNLYHLNGSLKQRATGERLHKLISTHPNSYMTPQEFWELVVTCLCLRGNFYAYKVKAFGEVAELLPVDPGCVVPGYVPDMGEGCPDQCHHLAGNRADRGRHHPLHHHSLPPGDHR